jgi:hypothetical protein
MKSFIPEKQKGLTVGDIIDAMAKIDEFGSIGRENIFAVVEAFLAEYVGLPGTLSTRKFGIDDAKGFAVRFDLPFETIVRIIAVFRMRASLQSGVKTKIMNAYNKVRMKGGGARNTPVSRS